jgi:arylsulfatase A-like enzyme
MRVDLRGSAAPGYTAPLAGAGVAAIVGLAELARAALASSATPHDLQRSVLLVLAVYPALGAVAGLACWMAGRVWAAPAAALALLVAIAADSRAATPLAHLADLALGILVLRLLALPFDRARELPRARLAASGALLALSAVCALAARALPAYGPRWALGAAVAALGGAVLVWTPRVRASAFLLAAGSIALLWQGAEHVQRLAPSAKPAASAPSVLLVTIDALRADHVGAYGAGPEHTPNLDRLAAQGARFERAYSQAIAAGPSHATILSGRSPLGTGFLRSGQGVPRDTETLAEALARAGYVTAAFPSSPALADPAVALAARFQVAGSELGERRRFPAFAYRCVALRPLERWLEEPVAESPYRSAAATTDLAIQFLSVHAAAPTFVWVHYANAQLPFRPAPEPRPSSASERDWTALTAQERAALVADPARLGALRARYEAEVASVDRELGRLLAAARDAAPAGGLAVVVTSPHGEPMGEHGHYWARDLYEPTLHVPLVMLPPPRAASEPRAVPELVRLMDVAPTLLDWLGVPALAQAEGASLAPLVAGAASGSPGPLLAVAEPAPDQFAARAAAVRRDAWKLIWRADGLWAPDHWSAGGYELYDLAADPREATNLAATRLGVLVELVPLLPPDWASPTPPAPAVEAHPPPAPMHAAASDGAP